MSDAPSDADRRCGVKVLAWGFLAPAILIMWGGTVTLLVLFVKWMFNA